MALTNTTQYAGDVQVRLAPFHYFLPITIICAFFILRLVQSSSLSSCQLANLKIQFSVIILSSFSYIVNKGKTLKCVIYLLMLCAADAYLRNYLYLIKVQKNFEDVFSVKKIKRIYKTQIIKIYIPVLCSGSIIYNLIITSDCVGLVLKLYR